MVRVIGGGATGAGACCGSAAARRASAPSCMAAAGRVLILRPEAAAASAACPDAAACRLAGRTGCDGSGRGPPSIAGGVALRRARLADTDAGPAGAPRLPVAACGGRGGAAARRAAAAARAGASAAAAARSAAPCRVLRRAGECSAARSGRRPSRATGGWGARRCAAAAAAATAADRFGLGRRAAGRLGDRRGRRLGDHRRPGHCDLDDAARGASTGSAAARRPSRLRGAARRRAAPCGFTSSAFLIRRGGPSVGAAGLGGSGAAQRRPSCRAPALRLDGLDRRAPRRCRPSAA